METFVIVGHVLAAMAMIGLILLQQGKGAEMGASFGAGASQTVFGSQGSGNFFSRMTAFIAVIFFVTSFTLALIAKEKVSVVDNVGIPTVLEQPVDIPEADDAAEPGSDIPAPASDLPDADSSDIPQPAAESDSEQTSPQTEEQQ